MDQKQLSDYFGSDQAAKKSNHMSIEEANSELFAEFQDNASMVSRMEELNESRCEVSEVDSLNPAVIASVLGKSVP